LQDLIWRRTYRNLKVSEFSLGMLLLRKHFYVVYYEKAHFVFKWENFVYLAHLLLLKNQRNKNSVWWKSHNVLKAGPWDFTTVKTSLSPLQF
jgi:hypothetical protein